MTSRGTGTSRAKRAHPPCEHVLPLELLEFLPRRFSHHRFLEQLTKLSCQACQQPCSWLKRSCTITNHCCKAPAGYGGSSCP